MAFKLSKANQKQKEEFTHQLREKFEAFEELQLKKAPVDELTHSLAEFLVVLSEVETFRDELATEFRDQFEEKSDKWQESDAASEAEEFISAWEEADFSEPDLGDLTELELDDYAGNLEDLPDEVNQ
jgi:glutamate/tyrosine decarboxylase-like PLP-dependent enzyme